MRFRPQIFTAIVALAIIGLSSIFFAQEYIEVVAGGCITGIGMLGMKLLETE